VDSPLSESRRGLDIGRCFNEAIAVYKENFLILFVAAILFQILSGLSLFILCGPLEGGVCLMTLNALRRNDRTAQLGDLFGAFDKFGRLVGLFFLVLVLTLLGLVACVLPGLALMTIWLFPFFLVVDRGMTVFDALSASKDIVMRNGFWKNLLLVLIAIALTSGPDLIPYAGVIVSFFLAPLGWLVMTSAYLQQAPDAAPVSEEPAPRDEPPNRDDLGEAIKPGP